MHQMYPGYGRSFPQATAQTEITLPNVAWMVEAVEAEERLQASLLEAVAPNPELPTGQTEVSRPVRNIAAATLDYFGDHPGFRVTAITTATLAALSPLAAPNDAYAAPSAPPNSAQSEAPRANNSSDTAGSNPGNARSDSNSNRGESAAERMDRELFSGKATNSSTEAADQPSSATSSPPAPQRGKDHAASTVTNNSAPAERLENSTSTNPTTEPSNPSNQPTAANDRARAGGQQAPSSTASPVPSSDAGRGNSHGNSRERQETVEPAPSSSTGGVKATPSEQPAPRSTATTAPSESPRSSTEPSPSSTRSATPDRTPSHETPLPPGVRVAPDIKVVSPGVFHGKPAKDRPSTVHITPADIEQNTPNRPSSRPNAPLQSFAEAMGIQDDTARPEVVAPAIDKSANDPTNLRFPVHGLGVPDMPPAPAPAASAPPAPERPAQTDSRYYFDAEKLPADLRNRPKIKEVINACTKDPELMRSYVEVANVTGVSPELLATLHWRENSCSRKYNSNGQGIYQDYERAGRYKRSGVATYDEMVAQGMRAVEEFAGKIGGKQNLRKVNHRNPDYDRNLLADGFFGYNGKAKLYYTQSKQFGVNTPGWMGSPYVANLMDNGHDSRKNPNWKQYLTDGGNIGLANQQIGALPLYEGLVVSSRAELASLPDTVPTNPSESQIIEPHFSSLEPAFGRSAAELDAEFFDNTRTMLVGGQLIKIVSEPVPLDTIQEQPEMPEFAPFTSTPLPSASAQPSPEGSAAPSGQPAPPPPPAPAPEQPTTQPERYEGANTEQRLILDRGLATWSHGRLVYGQRNALWGDESYGGDSTFGSSACGPFAGFNAAAAVGLRSPQTVEEVKNEVSKNLRNGNRIVGVGTKNDVIAEYISSVGGKTKNLETSSKDKFIRGIEETLSNGGVVVTLAQNGSPTANSPGLRSGHFYVITKMADGRVQILDSYSPEKSDREADINQLYKELQWNKNMFAVGVFNPNRQLAPAPAPVPPPESAPAPQDKHYGLTLTKEMNLASKDIYPGYNGPISRKGYGVPMLPNEYAKEEITCFYDGYAKTPGTHTGIDLGANYQTVIAAKNGRVIGVTNGTVVIKHPDGKTTNYQHLSSYKVKVGDDVLLGQPIAISGERNSEGAPHLHFTVSNVDGVPSRLNGRANVYRDTDDPFKDGYIHTPRQTTQWLNDLMKADN